MASPFFVFLHTDSCPNLSVAGYEHNYFVCDISKLYHKFLPINLGTFFLTDTWFLLVVLEDDTREKSSEAHQAHSNISCGPQLIKEELGHGGSRAAELSIGSLLPIFSDSLVGAKGLPWYWAVMAA